MKIKHSSEFDAALNKIESSCASIREVMRCIRYYLDRDPWCGKAPPGIESFRVFPIDKSWASPDLTVVYIIDTGKDEITLRDITLD